MSNQRLNIERTRAASFRLVAAVAVVMGVALSLACNSGQSTGTDYVIPTPTPGPLTDVFNPKVTDTNGTLSVEVFVGYEGYTQQGAAILEESETGTELRISVRPAPGIIQLANIREGTCDDIGRWLESVEHAVGGESISNLPEFSLADLFDGNHVVTLSFPNGGINDVATCGQLPAIDIEGLR